MEPVMEIIFLGTGTSQGIPVIGCDCEVCQSSDPRDKRLRTSVFIKIEGKCILIDVSPDFRLQMLRNQLSNVDSILLTHEHNDHIIGMDDVRPINFKYQKDIPVLALPRVLDQVQQRFHYAFEASAYPGAPRLKCIPISHATTISMDDMNQTILPFDVLHGTLNIVGYRIRNFAYITDASYIAESSLDLLRDLDVLVINALQRKKHFSHFTLEEALQVVELLKPRQTYLTHLSHDLGRHETLLGELPAHVMPAFDNLSVYC